MQKLIIKVFCVSCCVLTLLCSPIAGAASQADGEPQTSYSWNLDLKQESQNSYSEAELEKFLTRLKLKFSLLKPHLSLDKKESSGEVLFIQVYDRPNDDPHQNAKLREELGLSEKEAFAYSTARMILIMRIVPTSAEDYDVQVQWLAQMMVGTHTDSALNCHIEFNDQKFPLQVSYPNPEITRYSDTKLKKYSVVSGPKIKVASFSTRDSKLIEGSFPIKRGQHLHYKVDYRLGVTNGILQEVSLSTTNDNPNFADTDAYLVGSFSPVAEYMRPSPFIDRPDEEVKTIEITGDGAQKLGEIFKKNNCLSCHAADGEGGEKFDKESGTPLDPSDLWHSLGHLISTYGDDEREYMVNYTYRDKWPSKMNSKLLEMLNNEEDRNYLREWLLRNKAPEIAKHP